VRITALDARGPALRGPTAIGALAVGATAVGAVAIGRLAIGRAAIQAVAVLQQAVGAWDDFKLTADEFYENGDTVVVLGHTDVKKGGESAQLPVVHIWRFRGDDEVCRLQILTDTLQGARLLGKA
jgi:ketosteroid isomerase-like protein